MTTKKWERFNSKGFSVISWRTKPNIDSIYQVILIFPPKHTEEKKWMVRYPSKSGFGVTVGKYFDTKNDAIKFAKLWMEKHPNG